VVEDTAPSARTLPGDLAEAALALACVLGGLVHLGVAVGALGLALSLTTETCPGGGAGVRWGAAALGVLPVHVVVLEVARRLARRHATAGRAVFAVGWLVPAALLGGVTVAWVSRAPVAAFFGPCL
jgi:hypothetical protein